MKANIKRLRDVAEAFGNGLITTTIKIVSPEEQFGKLSKHFTISLKEAFKRYGYEAWDDGIALVRKGISPRDMEFEEGERASVDYITTRDIDRDGEIVVPKGIILDHYRQQPVVLWCHDYHQLPVGKSLWVKNDELGLISKTKYASHPKAQEIFDYRREGFPMAKSIGFIPFEYATPDEYDSLNFQKLGIEEGSVAGSKVIFTKALLLEYSDVPVPSNPKALQIAISKGLVSRDKILDYYGKDTLDEVDRLDNALQTEIKESFNITTEVSDNGEQEKANQEAEEVKATAATSSDNGQEGQGEEKEIKFDIEEVVVENNIVQEAPKEGDEWANFYKVDEKDLEEGVPTEKPYPNEHACRLRDPSKFQDGSFRRTTRDHEGKKYSIIMGKLKGESTMTEQAYRYNKASWSASEARSHCSGHKGSFEAAANTESMLDEALNSIKAVDGTLVVTTPKRLTTQEHEVLLTSIEKTFPNTNVLVVQDGITIRKIGAIKQEWQSINVVKDKDSLTAYVDGKERWNRQLSKTFDVERMRLEPYNFIYALASKFLECKVKNISIVSHSIPSAMIGNYLLGMETFLGSDNYKTLDIRNIDSRGSELPPIYEDIRLNSKTFQRFLVDGMRFIKYENQKEEGNFVVSVYPIWGGLGLSFYTEKGPMSDHCESLLKELHEWVDENNTLRGEKFSLGGEFLPIDKSITWEDIVLEDRAIKALHKVAEANPATSRGTLLAGPPGTGKTMGGRVVMNNTDATFIWLSARDFEYVGAFGGLRMSFTMARKLAPTILFIEDIDNWLSDRTLDLLKTEMDGLKQSIGIYTVLTSNYPERLPDAIIDRPGRFHDILLIDLPTSGQRGRMFSKWMDDVFGSEVVEKEFADPEDRKKLLDVTEGYSGAHIRELIVFAKSLLDDGSATTVSDAMSMATQKIAEQKELINRLRGDSEKKKGIDTRTFRDEIDITTFADMRNEKVVDEVEEKEGRVLSTKNRSVVKKAIDAMGDAVVALDELYNATEPAPKDTEKLLVVEGKESTDELVTIVATLPKLKEKKNVVSDEEQAKEIIVKQLKELLSSPTPLDITAMVSDSLRKKQGRLS